MQTLNLCLLVVQILMLLAICLLAWQIWSLLKRKDIPEDTQLTETQIRFIVIRLRFIVIFLAIGAILGIVQAILRFVSLYFS